MLLTMVGSSGSDVAVDATASEMPKVLLVAVAGVCRNLFRIGAQHRANISKQACQSAGVRRRGRSDIHLHALTSEHLARASEWQLVLQIDSDIEVGMEWGDIGQLYLCARKEDLAARRIAGQSAAMLEFARR
jgi:Domain of unknown function (DUF1963)